MEHVFNRTVLHNGQEFKVGTTCPKELKKEMLQKGLVDAAPEARELAPAPAVAPTRRRDLEEPKTGRE